MKVVINNTYGWGRGFYLSRQDLIRLAEMGSDLLEWSTLDGIDPAHVFDDCTWHKGLCYIPPIGNHAVPGYIDPDNNRYAKLRIPYPSDVFSGDEARLHPDLVALTEELIEEFGEENAHLKIVNIPDGTEFYIEYDDCGIEIIHEVHRTWT